MLVIIIFFLLGIGGLLAIIGYIIDYVDLCIIGACSLALAIILSIITFILICYSPTRDVYTLESIEETLISEENQDELLNSILTNISDSDSSKIDFKVRINNNTKPKLIVLKYKKENQFESKMLQRLIGNANKDKTETKCYLYINKPE